jgi:hypothetical protein
MNIFKKFLGWEDSKPLEQTEKIGKELISLSWAKTLKLKLDKEKENKK